MSKLVCILLVALVFATIDAKPQVEHGSIHGPSGRFEHTHLQAAPPVDLSRPPIFLPEATPIHEKVREFHEATNLWG